MVDQVNIVCGFYVGDFIIMMKVVRLVKQYGVVVGVYLGFLDKEGFGCRFMDILLEDFYC